MTLIFVDPFVLFGDQGLLTAKCEKVINAPSLASALEFALCEGTQVMVMDGVTEIICKGIP